MSTYAEMQAQLALAVAEFGSAQREIVELRTIISANQVQIAMAKAQSRIYRMKLEESEARATRAEVVAIRLLTNPW